MEHKNIGKYLLKIRLKFRIKVAGQVEAVKICK
jgi:hypothetical protein